MCQALSSGVGNRCNSEDRQDVCVEGGFGVGVVRRGQDQNSFYFLDIYLIVPAPVVERLFSPSIELPVVFQKSNWLHM